MALYHRVQELAGFLSVNVEARLECSRAVANALCLYLWALIVIQTVIRQHEPPPFPVLDAATSLSEPSFLIRFGLKTQHSEASKSKE